MKPKPRSKRSSVASRARGTPRLPVVPPSPPVEVTEMCLRFSIPLEVEHYRFARLKQIGSLRLVSRRFSEVFTKELFNSVTLCLAPLEGRPAAFLGILHKNSDILKHIRHLTIQLSSYKDNLSSTDSRRACEVVRTFSQAPLSTLTIEELDKDFQCPSVFNALHALRSIRSLQTLHVSGTAIPPFLVCGHFSSTRLKAINFPSLLWDISSPDESTKKNLALQYGLSTEPDSVLATAFQPFANIEELDFPNAMDIPKYFPLQDFSSTHYPSNGRIPFTLPVLRELRVGHFISGDDRFPLNEEDYKVLATLLCRAPRLKALCISDEFWSHDGLDDFTPLLDELPSLKNLRRLDLIDNNNRRGEAIDSISSLLGAFSPVPSLKTLRIDIMWAMWDADATRASLYFSEAWQKLRRALASPALASLRVLMLDVTIRITDSDCEEPESFGPEELDGFKEALINLYSQDGELDVIVNIDVVLLSY